MPVMVDSLFKLVSADPEARRVGRKHGHQWCHMWCEPGEEEQLHELATKIGMRRAWYQPHRLAGHYDLVPTRRAAAIEAGAIETDFREWLRAKRDRTQST